MTIQAIVKFADACSLAVLLLPLGNGEGLVKEMGFSPSSLKPRRFDVIDR